MGADRLLAALAGACLAASIGAIGVLLVRRSLRSVFGASPSYIAWGVVPCSIGVGLWPGLPAASTAPDIVLRIREGTAALNPLHVLPAGDQAGPFCWAVAWAIGCAAMALAFAVQHAKFTRALGPLHRQCPTSRVSTARSASVGPLSLGVWKPAVVVPADFRSRYTSRERLLIVAHEHVHIRRCDAIANVGCAVLQCLFWFNPLMHACAGLFRFDQELACDAAVLRRRPRDRRSYAQAIVKTQTALAPIPLCCQWQSIHPLKERLLMLQRPPHSVHRRRVGHAAIAALAAVTAYGAWAVQSTAPTTVDPSAALYDLAVTFELQGKTVSPKLRTKAGVPSTLEFGDAGATLWSQFVITPARTGRVAVWNAVKIGAEPLPTQELMLAIGQAGHVHFDADAHHPALDMAVKVTPAGVLR